MYTELLILLHMKYVKLTHNITLKNDVVWLCGTIFSHCTRNFVLLIFHTLKPTADDNFRPSNMIV